MCRPVIMSALPARLRVLAHLDDLALAQDENAVDIDDGPVAVRNDEGGILRERFQNGLHRTLELRIEGRGRIVRDADARSSSSR
jgi:hypothetical protein